MGAGGGLDRDDVCDRTHRRTVGQRLVFQNLELRAGKISAEELRLTGMDVWGEPQSRIRRIQETSEADRKFPPSASFDAQPDEPGTNDQAQGQGAATFLL